MSFFTKKSKKSLIPAWTYRGDGLIWMLRFSGAGRIVGEIRNPERKTATYFCLDENSGVPLWENRAMRDAWWIGIEDVTAERIYLHGYRKPDMPQHAGIIAVDVESGDVLWDNPDYVYLFSLDGSIYASRRGFEALSFFMLDPASGSVTQAFGTDAGSVQEARMRLDEIDAFAGYDYPVPLDAGHPASERAYATVVPHTKGLALRGPIDVLARNGILAASWHEHTGRSETGQETFAQRFAAWDSESGLLISDETIAHDVAAPGADSFFTKDRQLFYIQDGAVLTAFPFPDAGP